MIDRPPGGIRLRPAGTDDLAACADVWRAGLDGYGSRVGRLPMATAPASLVPLLDHLRATDPDGFLVAVRSGSGGAEHVVAFTSAIRREDVWFLGMLFVRPDEQARGLGRRLLEAVLPPHAGTRAPAARRAETPGAAEPNGPTGDTPADLPPRLATCTDAAQPISNALYARYAIVPRVPILELVGHPDRSRLPPLPAGVRAVPFEILGAGSDDGPGGRHLAATVAALDRATLGYAHPQDHAFVAGSGRFGYVFLAGDGRAVGYGYTSPVGRLGPIAVEDEALLPGILGHLLGAVEPAGAFSAWVPGAAGQAVTALLEAGLQLEDFPALLCWDRPFADFSRYVPITLAVL